MDNSICNKDFKIFIEDFPSENLQNIILEATVPTGMENIAALEIIEKLNVVKENIFTLQGRLYFFTKIDDFNIVKELRSVDNINLVAHFIPSLNFTKNKEDDLLKINSIAENYNLLKSVQTWQCLNKIKCNITPLRDEHDIAKITRLESRNKSGCNNKVENNILKYRVSCNRSFSHSFTSVEAQHGYGGIINDKYNWVVALDDYDLNIILYIVNDCIMICLKLTQISLHNRCIIEFGPTSLRPTIAYNMLRLCQIKAGDIIVDPLCGGGSIPIEAILGYPNTVVYAGDNNSLAIRRCKTNINAISEHLNKADIFYWDAENLPIPDHSVDVVCTDLPFGKRSGSGTDIRLLYKNVLKEFGRIVKPQTGKICILVHQAHKVIGTLTKALYIKKKITVNVGGLKCYVFLLQPSKT